jgi:hypothetical protein
MYTCLPRALLSRVRQPQASQASFDNYVLYSSFFRIIARDQAEQSCGLVCAKDGRSPVLHPFKSTGYGSSTRAILSVILGAYQTQWYRPSWYPYLSRAYAKYRSIATGAAWNMHFDAPQD